MNAFPVIKRELRAQARQPFTYWLRAGAVVLALLAMGVFGLDNDFKPGEGAALLSSLHLCLFIGIWILVPTMTADCLSRERREGTLSLLFLTNLRPFDIVLAKITAQALRAFTFWLATLPAMTLPFLVGGAGWQHAVFSTLLNFTALCLALGAGVLASARCKTWVRALALAVCANFVAGLVFYQVNFAVLAAAFFGRSTSPTLSQLLGVLFSPEGMMVGLRLPLGSVEWLTQMRTPKDQLTVLTLESVMAGVSFLFLSFCLWQASKIVGRHWRDEPPSAFARWLERRFCTPIIGVSLLRRWMRRTLERNPIGWLEQRSWTGRTLTWSWLAVVTTVYTAVFSGSWFVAMRLEPFQAFVAWSLAVCMAFTAAGSFRRERETGVLELLLVSPVSSWRILGGRLRGIWMQFLPTLALLFGIWPFLFAFNNEHHSAARIIFFAVMLLAMPVIGLYFSLATRSFFPALLWTWLLGGLLPVLLQAMLVLVLPETDPSPYGYAMQAQPGGALHVFLGQCFGLFRSQGWRQATLDGPLLLAALLQVGGAVACAMRLHGKLENRQFALERGTL